MMTTRIVAVAVVLLVLAVANTASAQEPQPALQDGPTARPFGWPANQQGVNFFDYDAQMWAPFEITSVDGHTHANTGFFFEFDFVYWSITRPKPQPGSSPRFYSTGTDWKWGNRYVLGFMGDEGRGLTIDWTHSDGIFFANGQDILIAQPMLIDTSLSSVEINRTFRQNVQNGGYLEPYFGVRYISLNDSTIQDRTVTRFKQKVENSAIGGQIGARYFRRAGRWVFSFDTAVLAAYNSQSYFATTIGAGTVNFENTIDNQDFTPMLDIDMALQANLTRDISLRAGANVYYMWRGIARADTLSGFATTPFTPINAHVSSLTFPSAISTEDFIAAGLNFGIDWKR